MRLKISLTNYRSFGNSRSIHFELDGGLIALVGPNNSGKSTVLRFFYEFRPLLLNLPSCVNVLPENKGRAGLGAPEGIEDPVEVLSDLNSSLPLCIQVQWNVTEDFDCSGVKIKYNRETMCEIELLIGARWGIGSLSKNSSGVLTTSDGKIIGFKEFEKFLDYVRRVVYVPPYRNAINEGTGKYYSWEIGTSFIEKWSSWASSGNKANSQAMLSVVDEIERIFGYRSLSINASNDRRTFQIFADGKSYRLREKGAGLAQFIMVLGNLAMLRPSIVFIDEPELNLHPLMQSKFVEAIAKYSEHGVMFATHSLGLARLADRIYSVRRGEDHCSELRPFEQITGVAEFLGEMGFAGYRDLGYRTVVAVEGRTDTKPIRAMLRKLRKDHEIVVLPLHGTNMITKDREHELAELRRLADRVFVLIDSERTCEGEAISERIRRFIEQCEALQIQTHATDRRALENYFSQRNVDAVFLGQGRKALKPYEKVNCGGEGWSKQDNWRLANEMTREELLETDVGNFLNSI